MAEDYLKPGDLYLIQQLPHHYHPTHDSDFSFSGCTTVWMIKNWEFVDLFFSSQKNEWENFTKEQIQHLW